MPAAAVAACYQPVTRAVRMLTVNQLPSSLPRSRSPFRRTALATHMSQHSTHRRRSLSHPAPSDVQDGQHTVSLRPHAEDEDEEDDDEEDSAVDAESRERLSSFVLRETSGESSDEDEDESVEDDEDGSSSASSSGSTPLLKPLDNGPATVGKRAVTFHSSVSSLPAATTLPASARLACCASKAGETLQPPAQDINTSLQQPSGRRQGSCRSCAQTQAPHCGLIRRVGSLRRNTAHRRSADCERLKSVHRCSRITCGLPGPC